AEGRGTRGSGGKWRRRVVTGAAEDLSMLSVLLLLGAGGIVGADVGADADAGDAGAGAGDAGAGAGDTAGGFVGGRDADLRDGSPAVALRRAPGKRVEMAVVILPVAAR
ncbi:unnamed protein product, partial [Scytosiphon promiscuus]